MTSESSAALLEYIPIAKDASDCIAVLSLNRPKSANAFNAQMMKELSEHLIAVRENTTCRALVLRGMGKHFSAGADLAWMKEAANFSFEENKTDASRLLDLFESLYSLPIPTIALVRGSVYGGAVGLVASCDIALSEKKAEFCMSEVRLGLIPAVIFPYLARKINPGQLRRLSLTGRVFSAKEAQSVGLVEVICPAKELNEVVANELRTLLAGSPSAQKEIKRLHQHLVDHSLQQGTHTVESIAKARTGEEGQHGLSCFFSKQKPNWNFKLKKGWKLDEIKEN